LPVATRQTTLVRISKKTEARKNRSAGSSTTAVETVLAIEIQDSTGGHHADFSRTKE
jgi:hypothetical protein